MTETMQTREPVSDQDVMVRTVVSSLADRFAVDEHEIEATVRRHVDEWSERARIKTFVGIIAERHARAALQARSTSPPI